MGGRGGHKATAVLYCTVLPILSQDRLGSEINEPVNQSASLAVIKHFLLCLTMYGVPEDSSHSHVYLRMRDFAANLMYALQEE